jgi:hypothetical protein
MKKIALFVSRNRPPRLLSSGGKSKARSRSKVPIGTLPGLRLRRSLIRKNPNVSISVTGGGSGPGSRPC